MVKYVLKRLGYILVTLWIIITCTFFLMKNLPGTPFDAERFSIMTPAQQEKVLEMYGLNDSVPVQYVKYIGNMLTDRTSGSPDRSGSGLDSGSSGGMEA